MPIYTSATYEHARSNAANENETELFDKRGKET